MLIRLFRRLCGKLGLGKPRLDQNAVYDRETSAVVRKVLGGGDCAIDIGAHAGSILREIADAAPRGHHMAFEPIPALAARLRSEFPDVQVRECALSDRPGRAHFHHVVNDPAYSGLRQRTYDRPDPRIETIDVEVSTLDASVPAGRAVRFIKIDIEGGEYHALLGGRAVIERDRPLIVFEAGVKSSGHYGVTPEMFFDFFSGLGYSLSTMRRWLDGQHGFDRAGFAAAWQHDYYFIACPADPA